ncbi:glycosyltransferase family 4 protein [Paraburkholderia dokdonensis]|uniref:glycosyltransferase family 4 protein n=1 Tax=Paraburkholderia dokdonensis TaxID=2211211 RepID=UPI00101A5DC4|nr:glycosyltransferase family 4 protein [Paraburkholderia dokdonensis]
MKISYVNGVCVKNDAISNVIRDEIRALRSAGIDQIRLFSYRCENDDLPSLCVSELRDVAYDEHFLKSDVVIFHFGIFYPLFDLLAMTPVHSRKLVVFHNVTPKELVKKKDREVIEKSFAQMANIAWADHVLCDSDLNLEVLRSRGIRTPATVLPLAIHAPAVLPRVKPSFADGIVRVAFVGRFVKTKGPEELLAALKQLRMPGNKRHLKVDFVGNTSFSDQDVLRKVRETIDEINLDPARHIRAAIHGDADDATRDEILRDADVFVLPTWHEGFGMPIVEAIAAGCYVIAYDNSNTPSVMGGLGSLVPTGNIDALCDSLSTTIDKVTSTAWRSNGPESYAAYLKHAGAHARKYEPAKVAQDFVDFVKEFAA